MHALLLFDKDSPSVLAQDLKARVVESLTGNGHQVDVYELGADDVFQCLGCLRCLTEHPDECVHKDIINSIRRDVKRYGATVFLTPVLFGHYSSTIASAINRGTGSHNRQVIIGFAESITDEEKSTFIDLTARHRGEADIVHPGMDKRVDVYVTTSVDDNAGICEEVANVD